MLPFRCTVCDADPERQPDCSACFGSGVHRLVDLCPDPWNEVAPRLYVGCHDYAPIDRHGRQQDWTEADTALLKYAGFQMIISFYQRESCAPPNHVEHHYFRVPDGALQPDELLRMRELGELAWRVASQGKKVLIRCQAGLNRSSLCAAFALQHYGLTPWQAIDRIRENRSRDALCNGEFVDYILKEPA